MTSSMELDGVTSFLHLRDVTTLQLYVNVCDIVSVLAGVLQCNGRKLEEDEDFECVFVVYSVLESK